MGYGDIEVDDNTYRELYAVQYINNSKSNALIYPIIRAMITSNPGNSDPLFLKNSAESNGTNGVLHIYDVGNHKLGIRNQYASLANVGNVLSNTSLFVYGKK